MKPTDQHKRFAIIATLFVSLCAFALVVVQNYSLNTQISSLENELERHHNSGYDTQRNVLDTKRITYVRSQGEQMNERWDLGEESDMELDLEKEDGLVRRVRKLSSKKSGSGKSSKKSSKRDCSSSRTNDSASSEESSDESTSQALCEGM
jgi:hypothetical protein